MRFMKKQEAAKVGSEGQNDQNDLLTETLVDNSVLDKATVEQITKGTTPSKGANRRKTDLAQTTMLVLKKIGSFFVKLKDLITYAGEKTLPMRKQIRFKLVAAFLVPALCIIILGVSSYFITKSTLVTNSENSAEVGIESTSMYIDLLMVDIQTRTSQIAGGRDFISYYNTFDKLSVPDASEMYTKIEDAMLQQKSSSVGIYTIYAFGSKGKPVTTLEKSPADSMYTDFSASEEATTYASYATKKGGVTSAWIGYHNAVDEDAGSSSDYYVATYVRGFSKGEGYIICDLLKDKVEEVLKSTLVSDGSMAAFITQDGRETIVTGKNKELPDLSDGKTIFVDQSFYKKALEDEKSSGNQLVTYNGAKYLFVYAKIGESGSAICTLIPQSDILSQLKLTRFITSVLVIISCLVALFVGLILSTDIAKVINKFSNTFKHVSDGDLSIRINSKRQDEFGVLAHDMDDMIDQIRTLVADMANFGRNVSDAAYKVSGASGEILTSVNEVSDTVNVMNQGVSEQAMDTEKSFLQMTEFAGQIGEAYEDTQKVGQVANKTQQTVSNGKNIVDDLMQQVTSTSEVTSIIIKDIDELQQQSKNIGSVVETINDIASTTNLLSLNASIEAARAGDAGRGFAVVAEQIRSLAEQSVESVKRIERIIKTIQHKTEDTVTSAKNAEQMLGSQTEALNNTVKVFQDVDHHMLDLINKIDSITSNMQTITVSKDEVLDAIKNIAAVTQQTLASSEVVGTNISTQITAVETLNLQAEEMKEKATALEEAIDKFTI